MEQTFNLTKPKKRLANLELLRIVSMVFIVVLHTIGHGNVLKSLEVGSVEHNIFILINAFCVVAVNVYVLISGYFLSTSKFKIRKLLYIIILTWFYSVVIYSILVITRQIDFGWKGLVISLFPIITGKYWFITCYFLLYLISPFLNVLINNVSKKQFLAMLGILLTLFCVVPTIAFNQDSFGGSKGVTIIWFVCLYFVGAFLRKYNITMKCSWLFYTGCSLLLFLSTFILRSLEKMILGKVLSDTVLFNYNSALTFASSVFLFLSFASLNIKEGKLSKFICFISPATLCVYLLHDEPNMREWLWNFLNLPQYIDSGLVFLLVPVVVISIFCIGITLGLLTTRISRFIAFIGGQKKNKIDDCINDSTEQSCTIDH